MIRLILVGWVCCGALSLGIVVLEATRQKKEVSGWWYFVAPILGPIFLFFILPLWLGNWGRAKRG